MEPFPWSARETPAEPNEFCSELSGPLIDSRQISDLVEGTTEEFHAVVLSNGSPVRIRWSDVARRARCNNLELSVWYECLPAPASDNRRRSIGVEGGMYSVEE